MKMYSEEIPFCSQFDTFSMPGDPKESKSDWTSLEIGFLGIVGPLFLALLAVVILVICSVQNYRKPGRIV